MIRPLQPGDADRLRDGFERLSPESRYRRFESVVDELSDEQVHQSFRASVLEANAPMRTILRDLGPGRTTRGAPCRWT